MPDVEEENEDKRDDYGGDEAEVFSKHRYIISRKRFALANLDYLVWSGRPDLNRRPRSPEPRALPTAPRPDKIVTKLECWSRTILPYYSVLWNWIAW